MKVKEILEIRIFPPFAIGRLGSSPEPLENYTWVYPSAVSGRKVVPADTLIVDASGEVTLRKANPERPIAFKDSRGRVHPVAPFLEVWARFAAGGDLEPLTETHLTDLGLTTKDVRWQVTVGNIKVFRRTTNADDRIFAETPSITNHKRHELVGRCTNFLDGKTLPLGHVQYIKPNKTFPEIRFRFTPAAGYVYGASTSPPNDTNRLINDPTSEIANLKDRVFDSSRTEWEGFNETEHPEIATTIPIRIYAGADPDDNNHVSYGYIDDECDGLVNVALTHKNKTLTAYARIVAGPPAFAPDHIPVRTVADELEQALLGPKPTGKIDPEEVKDILRRAMETTSLMNVAFMNDSSGMAVVTDDYRLHEPIFDPNVADTLAIVARHQNILLTLEASGLAWFARVLRQYNEVGDISDWGRRKMPALMRGADGSPLALTRRQHAKITIAAGLAKKP